MHRVRQAPEDAGFIPDASLPYIIYAENICFSRNFTIVKHCVQHFNDFTKSSDSRPSMGSDPINSNFRFCLGKFNGVRPHESNFSFCLGKFNGVRPHESKTGMIKHSALIMPTTHFFSISASFQRSVWISNGFAMCSFMPAARAFSRSSAKALAVMATIGICAFAGSGSARIRRVAS